MNINIVKLLDPLFDPNDLIMRGHIKLFDDVSFKFYLY